MVHADLFISDAEHSRLVEPAQSPWLVFFFNYAVDFRVVHADLFISGAEHSQLVEPARAPNLVGSKNTFQ